MKILKTLLIILVVAVVALALTKNIVVKAGVEKGVEAVTGLKMSIEALNIGVIKTLVGVNDLKLYNPEGFKDPVMLNMKEIYVEYDLPAIFKGKVHLAEMRIDLKEFVVVKNEKGVLNLDSLKAIGGKKTASAPAEAEAKKAGKAPEIQIDRLRLRIGKVIYKDYSKGAVPSVQEFNIGIDEEFTGIKDPNSLVSVIVVKALMGTPIAKLANFDIGALQNSVSGTLSGAQEALTGITSKTSGALSGVQESMTGITSKTSGTLTQTTKTATDAVKGTTETLKTTAEDLKKAIKLPFGGSSTEE